MSIMTELYLRQYRRVRLFTDLGYKNYLVTYSLDDPLYLTV